MYSKYYKEFPEIYSRLMHLELKMKKMLISSLAFYYKEDILSEFEKFFTNKDRLKRYENKSGNAFAAIIKNPQIKKNSEKFAKLVNIMFLSDVLFIILCCEQFRKEEIVKNFYYEIPDKYSKLIKSRQLLLDLRNTIAHYNFKNYDQNRLKYLKVLEMFEKYTGCRL